MSAKSIFDDNHAIIEDDSLEDTTKVLEHLDQGIQKTFLILFTVSQNQRCSAVAKPGAE